MAEQELREAFNDCVDRMAAGQSIGECLRLYPQHAARLRPMLEVGSLVARAQADARDVAGAQARVRSRVRSPAFAPPRQRAYSRLQVLAASLLIVFAAVLAAAENSLPGDSLYGIKRLGENARGTLMGQDFGTRRVDEIRVLLALQREADVEFSGTVERMAAALWQVSGLEVAVGAGTEQPEAVRVGDSVQVSAHTTEQGDLVALTIRRIEPQQPTPLVPVTEALSPTAQPSETATPALSATLTATAAPTAVPVKFGAPTLSSPIFDLGKGVKDERHFPSDALVFRWTSVGALGTDECYLVAVEFSPGAGDKFLARCGDQTPAQAAVQFTLNQPNRASPNYSSLLPWPVSDTTVSWTVTVVKNLGLQTDKVHYNTAPLSPASSQAQFPLKGS